MVDMLMLMPWWEQRAIIEPWNFREKKKVRVRNWEWYLSHSPTCLSIYPSITESVLACLLDGAYNFTRLFKFQPLSFPPFHSPLLFIITPNSLPYGRGWKQKRFHQYWVDAILASFLCGPLYTYTCMSMLLSPWPYGWSLHLLPSVKVVP